MRKLLFTFLLATFAFTFSSVQAVEKGDLVIQPSLNLGGFAYAGGWGGFNVGTTVNVQYAVHDYVSVGGYFGFNANTGTTKFRRIGFGATGTFHFWQLIDDKVDKDLKSDKVDFYFPVHLGYHLYRFGGSNSYLKKGVFRGGAGLGVRYYFNDKIGVAFETGGMEMSWAKIGVAIKL